MYILPEALENIISAPDTSTPKNQTHVSLEKFNHIDPIMHNSAGKDHFTFHTLLLARGTNYNLHSPRVEYTTVS